MTMSCGRRTFGQRDVLERVEGDDAGVPALAEEISNDLPSDVICNADLVRTKKGVNEEGGEWVP
jgi:hypothetical protein